MKPKRKYQRDVHNYPVTQVQTRIGVANVQGYDQNRYDWEIWNPQLEGLTFNRICNIEVTKDGAWRVLDESKCRDAYHLTHVIAVNDITAALDDVFFAESQQAYDERKINEARDSIKRFLGLKEKCLKDIEWYDTHIEESRQVLRDYGQSPMLPIEMQQTLDERVVVDNEKGRRRKASGAQKTQLQTKAPAKRSGVVPDQESLSLLCA